MTSMSRRFDGEAEADIFRFWWGCERSSCLVQHKVYKARLGCKLQLGVDYMPPQSLKWIRIAQGQCPYTWYPATTHGFRSKYELGQE